MKVVVKYFASLREARGCNQEELEIEPASVCSLYVQLAQQYSFKLPSSIVRFAVNGEFVEPDTLLQQGDQIAFIPPVAGG